MDTEMDPEDRPERDPLWVAKEALDAGKDLQLRYMDRVGQVTDRRIRPHEIEDGRRIRAHCFLRGEQRHFLCDRIVSAEVVERTSDDEVPF